MITKGKVFKVGNGSYGIRLKKAYVIDSIVKEGEELEINLPIVKNNDDDKNVGSKTWTRESLLMSPKTGVFWA